MKIPVSEILVDHIHNVSRDPVSADSCHELAITIGQLGLINPVLVRPIEQPEYNYKLVTGYRRMVAMAGILGYTEVEAYVREDITSDDQAHIINLSENLDRNNLTFWEQCKGLHRAFPEGTHETTIASGVSRSRTWVRSRWLVWRMPEEVIAQVEEGLLTATDVGLLIQKTPSEQLAAAKKLMDGKEEGNTTNSMLSQFSRRRSIRSKKDIQAVMTKLLDMERCNEMHSLRFALGDISDTQLFELIK